MGRKVEIPVPSSDLFSIVRDVLLFKGDYTICFYVFLLLYCAACCRYLRELQPNLKWFHAIPLVVLTSFGGGILVPITLGKPMVLHTNEAILPSMIAVWFVVNNVPGVLKLLQTRAGQLISNTGFEVFRYHVLANCSDLASKSLPPLSNGQLSVALTGPLLAGLLGGCGGAFMPLSNGLKAVEGKEIPWRIQSAAVMAVWHHLLMHDSAVRNFVSASVPFLADTDTIKCIGILFFAGLPVLQAVGLIPAGLLGPNQFTYGRKTKLA